MVQMVLHKEHLDEPYQDQPVKVMRDRREEMEKDRILGTNDDAQNLKEILQNVANTSLTHIMVRIDNDGNFFSEMEENELGPTDMREDLFDYFCEKLDKFCRQYSEEEKQLLSKTPKSLNEVPDFIKKVPQILSNLKQDNENATNWLCLTLLGMRHFCLEHPHFR